MGLGGCKESYGDVEKTWGCKESYEDVKKHEDVQKTY